MLTSINCSNNCIYQHEGKCSFNSTSEFLIQNNSVCAYFMPKNNLSIESYPTIKNEYQK